MSNPSGTAGAPLAFHPYYEQRDRDELDAIHALQNLFATMATKVAETEGRAQRAVHAKGHALLRGTLSVLPGLPAHLAQGLFATPATTRCCCAGRRRRSNNCRTRFRRHAPSPSRSWPCRASASTPPNPVIRRTS